MPPGAVFSLPPSSALSLCKRRCQGDATRALHVERLARSPRVAQPRSAPAGEAAALGSAPRPEPEPRGLGARAGSGPGLPRRHREQGGAAGRCRSPDLPRRGAAPAPGAPRSGPVLGRAEQRLRLRGERARSRGIPGSRQGCRLLPARLSRLVSGERLGCFGPGRAFGKREVGGLA